MNVEYPGVFSLLFLLPLVLIILWIGYVQGKHQVLSIIGKWKHTQFHNTFVVKYIASSFFFILAVVWLIFCLAGFYWGYETTEDDRVGAELVFVVDISNSMLAQDISPTRLERARSIIRAVVRNTPNIWFSLVAFKGSAVQLLPMTQDVVALERTLGTLSPRILTTPGTNVESGVDVAMNIFSSHMNTRPIILIFTDGEELTGNVQTTGVHAFNEGITIFPVAMGTVQGATIVSGDTVIRNEKGSPVISKLDRSVLESLAGQTRGRVFSVEEPGSVTTIVETIQEQVNMDEREGIRATHLLRYRLFAFLAFLALIIYVIIRVIPWKNTL